MTPDFYRILAKAAPFAPLSPEQSRHLYDHYQLLLRWNKTINLTRITALEEAIERHYAESLFLAAHLPPETRSVVDYGSGAGFPGFPTAILHPQIQVTLVESDQRKAAFLRETSDFAPNVVVKALRTEQLPGPYDVLISRAVKPVEVIKAARNLAAHVALLIAEEDAKTIKLPNPTILPLPKGGGVLFQAPIPPQN